MSINPPAPVGGLGISAADPSASDGLLGMTAWLVLCGLALLAAAGRRKGRRRQ